MLRYLDLNLKAQDSLPDPLKTTADNSYFQQSPKFRRPDGRRAIPLGRQIRNVPPRWVR
jgi:hypothetical protein